MYPIDDQAADRRADKKTELMRHRHQSLCFAFRTLRHRLEREGPAGRLNHRAADTLHEAKQDQLDNVLGKPAKKRT